MGKSILSKTNNMINLLIVVLPDSSMLFPFYLQIKNPLKLRRGLFIIAYSQKKNNRFALKYLQSAPLNDILFS